MHIPNTYRILLVLLFATGCHADEITVGAFSTAEAGQGLPSGWQLAKLPLVAPTQFQLVRLDGATVLQLDARNAAASLYRPLRIDAAQTPIVRWRWRIDGLIEGADLGQKEGDDLPARLYVMFDYPLERLPWLERTKIQLARSVAGETVPAAALCYVWDGDLAAGTRLWNAYTKRVRVIVVESGARRVGQWVEAERDVVADFREAFGEEPPPISGVAVGADTDQTGGRVRSWFGDIRFYDRDPNP